MCFSAEASFGASIIILSIGVVSLKKSRTVPQKVFSCIPLIFSVQQFTEGILWSSLTHPGLSQWVNPSAYIFLIFAQVVWPVIAPLSIRMLENNKNRKKILGAILLTGVIISCFLGYNLVTHRIRSTISCYHIQYDIEYPPYLTSLSIFYFLATVISPILSSLKKVRLLGYVILVSYVFTRVFYEKYLISVWCYFAALISVVVLSVIIQLNRADDEAVIEGFIIKKTANSL